MSDIKFSDGISFDTTSSSYHLTCRKDGWYVDYVRTDKQDGSVKEFIEKEGKWFNYIKGNGSLAFLADGSNMGKRTSQFNFQGLGIVSSIQNT